MRWRIKIQNSDLPGGKAGFRIQNYNSKGKINKIIEALLLNRGLKTKKQRQDFLNPSLKVLEQEFFEKKEVEKALQRIKKVLKNKEKIIVCSDYDADGITGGAILWETLDEAGLKVFPYVPDRISEGYGLSTLGIDNLQKFYPDTKIIITVDHGITAKKQVDYAAKKGIEVIITDHHTLPKNIPKALAIVHTTKLSGSGVAYIFSQKIRQAFKLKDSLDHLSLAAFGTIADLVPLVDANRVMAKFGLEELSKTKRLGIRALIDLAGLTGKKLAPYDVSFILAPRINATGRLTHALDSLRLLCTRDEERAKRLAAKLNSLNFERQQMLTSSINHAKNLVGSDITNLLFISHESYHEGVIGLVAGKLTEEFYRPSVVVAQREKYSKASARSISGFNIIEAIRETADILVDCGGHPMAAGFTIETKYLEVIKKRLTEIAAKKLAKDTLEKVLEIDAEINLDDISWALFCEIEKFAPFGIGNPEPVFATFKVRILDGRLVGRENQHLKLLLDSKPKALEAVGFNMGHHYSRLSSDKPVDLAYTLSLNHWDSRETIQLKIKDMI